MPVCSLASSLVTADPPTRLRGYGIGGRRGLGPRVEALENISTVLELLNEEAEVLELLDALGVRVGRLGVVAVSGGVTEDAVKGVGSELKVGIDEGDDAGVLREEQLRMVIKVELRE